MNNLIHKQCTKCKRRKLATTDNFDIDKRSVISNKRKLKASCKECNSGYNHKWYLKHKRKVDVRNKLYNKNHREQMRSYKNRYNIEHRDREKWRFILRKYGITRNQYEQMLKEQNNRCPICGKKFTKTNKPCCDHSHKTGKVRGLLCQNCNMTLGLLEKNLKGFLSYLKK